MFKCFKGNRNYCIKIGCDNFVDKYGEHCKGCTKNNRKSKIKKYSIFDRIKQFAKKKSSKCKNENCKYEVYTSEVDLCIYCYNSRKVPNIIEKEDFIIESLDYY